MDIHDRVQAILPTLDEYFETSVRDVPLPSLAAGVVYRGEVVYAKAFGHANFETGTPATVDTVYRIGSVSKIVTAVALMQQWEQGKFDLDDDINAYLPRDRVGRVGHDDPDAPAVTFRHLLTHTAGIGEIQRFSDLLHLRTRAYFVNPMNAPVLPLEDRLKKGIPCHVVPGTKWSYANHGASLLGYLVEQLDDAHEQFHDYVRHHIFDPVGMPRTDATWSDRVRDHLARGYAPRKDGGWKPKKFVRLWGRPAGGVFSSVTDMLAYARVLLAGGRLAGANYLLRPETLEEMWRPHYQLDPRLGQIGLIFNLFGLNGHRIVWHGGLVPYGFNSAFFLAPEDDLGVVLLANRSKGSPVYKIGFQLLWDVFDVDPAARPAAHHPRADDPAFLDTLAGTYGPQPGHLTNTRNLVDAGEYRVRREGTTLLLKSLWGAKRHGVQLHPADPADPYYFQVFEGLGRLSELPHESLLFVPDPTTGEVTAFHKGLRKFPKRGGVHSLRFKIIFDLVAILALAVIVIWLGALF